MRAILFDFDGTIVNSMPVIEQYMQQVFRKHHLQLDDDENFTTKGMSLNDFADWLEKHKHVRLDPEDIRIDKPSILEAINVFPGVKATLALLKARGYKTGIVTNSPRTYVEWLIQKHHLGLFFDTIMTEEDALAAKPDPRMLELACRALHVKFDQTVIIDDSPPGIQAGNALGMVTVRLGEQEQAAYAISSVNDLPDLLPRIRFTPR